MQFNSDLHFILPARLEIRILFLTKALLLSVEGNCDSSLEREASLASNSHIPQLLSLPVSILERLYYLAVAFPNLPMFETDGGGPLRDNKGISEKR
jgi:hypothetical protein